MCSLCFSSAMCSLCFSSASCSSPKLASLAAHSSVSCCRFASANLRSSSSCSLYLFLPEAGQPGSPFLCLLLPFCLCQLALILQLLLVPVPPRSWPAWQPIPLSPAAVLPLPTCARPPAAPCTCPARPPAASAPRLSW